MRLPTDPMRALSSFVAPHRALAVVLTLILAGCSGTGFPPGTASAPTGATAEVLGGTVALAAPRGYCPDESTLRDGPTGAFVLYGPCQGLGKAGPRARMPAVLTAAVAPTGGAPLASTKGIAALAEFLSTERGKSALSRTDSGAEVEVQSLQTTSDLILVRARDGATGDLAPDYWRAIFVAADALVTVTVSGTRAPDSTSDLSPADGRALIIDFVAAIRAANTTADTAATTATPQPEAKGLARFFKRLL